MTTEQASTAKQPITAAAAAERIAELAIKFSFGSTSDELQQLSSDVLERGRPRSSIEVQSPAGKVSVYFDSGWNPTVAIQTDGSELLTWVTTASVNWSAHGSVAPDRAREYARCILAAADVAAALNDALSSGVVVGGRSAAQIAADRADDQKREREAQVRRAEHLLVSAIAAKKMVAGCRVNGTRVENLSALIFSDEEVQCVRALGEHTFTSRWSALGGKTYEIKLVAGKIDGMVAATRTE